MTSLHTTFRFATVSPAGVEWLFKRNCSLTPVQMGITYACLCGVSLSVAGFFWWSGAPLVLPFAAIELLAVGVAFLLYARHAADRERIFLGAGRLVVEWECAGKIRREEFARDFVQVAPTALADALIEVRGGGRHASVGRYTRAELRSALAQEIRLALRVA
ncbi:DUF2244 domain-containing protein [Hydrogenophaga aquatica]